MPFYNKYPATNLNQPNMKWIIKQVKDDKELAEGAAADAAEARATSESAAEDASAARETAQAALDADRVTSVNGMTGDVTVAGASDAHILEIAGTVNIKKDITELYKNAYIQNAIPIYQSVTGWQLTGTGICRSIQGFKLDKYKVTPGSIVYLKIFEPTENSCSMQWQSSASVPGSGTNANLVGSPVIGNIDEFITVPDTATWLIVSNTFVSQPNIINNTAGVKIDKIQIDVSQAICKNIIGDDNRFYRIPRIHTGDKLAVSTSDGRRTVVTRTIEFYNANREYLDYYSLGTANSTRIISAAGSIDGAEYIRFRDGSTGYAQKIQIEFNDVVTEYVEHFDSPIQQHYLNEDAVPAFYTEHITAKANTINGNLDAHNVDDSFIFLTDFHDNSNSWNSPALVDYLMQHTGTHFMVFGGDSFNTSYNIPEAKSRMLKVVNAFDITPKFSIVGNHEGNDPSGTLSARRIGPNAAYNIMSMRQSFQYRAHAGADYTVYNDAAKIVYIFMSCSYAATITGDQITWFCGELLKIPDGYSVLVISHIGLKTIAAPEPCSPEMVAALAALKNKTSYSYSGQTYNFTHNVTVIGIISGHTHWDAAIVSNGINVIATTCDAYDENYENINGNAVKVPRTASTTNEHAFDVVQIDLTNKQLILTRIGYGNDRTISFS